MPSRWDAATRDWHRRVFHYPPPTLMSRNFWLPCTIELQPPSLDFTQNLEEAMDAIKFGRRHSWLESEGFSLSAANADVQELPATLYH